MEVIFGIIEDGLQSDTPWKFFTTLTLIDFSARCLIQWKALHFQLCSIYTN